MTAPARRVSVQPLDAHRFELGECARWDGRTLSVVDILDGAVWASDAGSPLEPVLRLDVPVSAALPGAGGSTVIAAGTGVAVLGRNGDLDWVDRHIADAEPPRRMNDAGVDRAGRMWCGSMALDGAPGLGALHRNTPSGCFITVVDSLGCPNGPAFSPDGRWMYLADSSRGSIVRFALDDTGELVRSAEFVRYPVPRGIPDGMAVDADGNLWVALWGGGAIAQLSPDGQVNDLIELPVRQPTSVCILPDRFVVTSARIGLDEPSTLDGAVLELDVLAQAPPFVACQLC